MPCHFEVSRREFLSPAAFEVLPIKGEFAYFNSTIDKRYTIRAKSKKLPRRLFGDDYTLKL